MTGPLKLPMILATLAFSASVVAQEAAPAPDFTFTGSLTGVSQYRLRGVSMSDENPAAQGSLTVAHKSGFHVGVWSSTLDGFGTFGGADLEFDTIGGYSTTLGQTTLDGGLIWYAYPGTSGHGYSEIYGTASHPLGPVNVTLGINYATRRKAIGDADNLYTFTDLALPLNGLPVTLKGHLGYTTGSGSIFSGPRGHYLDYSAGAEVAWKALTFGISYVGTNIDHGEADSYYSVPGGRPGHDLVKGAVLLSLSAAF
jgi:uncharacterized protein (TIGR02001 family)